MLVSMYQDKGVSLWDAIELGYISKHMLHTKYPNTIKYHAPGMQLFR